MRDIDRATTELYNVSSLTLMENAGTAVAKFVIGKFRKLRRVTVICGKGNNGGDGFVAARKFGDNGIRATVVLLADPAAVTGDAKVMLEKMQFQPIVVQSAEELESNAMTEALKADVIIDAILGTGFRPPVTGLYAGAIALVNRSRKPVIAVDIPSGADADAFTAEDSLRARADHIVTFTAPRIAHAFAPLAKGETFVAPIGSPDEAIDSQLDLHIITPREFAPLISGRDVESHKGTYGHALVIGGSIGKAGAAAMAGISALRSGAGLVTIATPRSVLSTVAGFAPEIMTESLSETDGGSISPRSLTHEIIGRILDGKDVVALGPGIGRHPSTVEFIHSFMIETDVPLIIDADGLNAFEGSARKLLGSSRPLVLTPHPGEMSRLTGLSIRDIQADRVGVARKFSTKHQCVLVLKGHRTLVALPAGAVWVNVTGNAGMATGGSGDVLSGMIAGMMAQTRDVASAVMAAVYLHGLAGDVAKEKMGEASLIAGDIIASLPEAFKRAKQSMAAKGFVFHA